MRTFEEEETWGSLFRLCMAPAISAWLSLGSREAKKETRLWVRRTDLEPTSFETSWPQQKWNWVAVRHEERTREGSKKREDLAGVHRWDGETPETLFVSGHDIVSSDLQGGGGLNSTFEVVHREDQSLAEVHLLNWDDL